MEIKQVSQLDLVRLLVKFRRTFGGNEKFVYDSDLFKLLFKKEVMEKIFNFLLELMAWKRYDERKSYISKMLGGMSNGQIPNIVEVMEQYFIDAEKEQENKIFALSGDIYAICDKKKKIYHRIFVWGKRQDTTCCGIPLGTWNGLRQNSSILGSGISFDKPKSFRLCKKCEKVLEGIKKYF